MKLIVKIDSLCKKTRCIKITRLDNGQKTRTSEKSSALVQLPIFFEKYHFFFPAAKICFKMHRKLENLENYTVIRSPEIRSG